MWKCPKCGTVNNGTLCTLCGEQRRSGSPPDVPADGAEDYAPASVNPLHFLAWIAAFSHLIFFFLPTCSAFDSEIGKIDVSLFMVRRFFSACADLIVQSDRVMLLFSGVVIAQLILSAVLIIATLYQLISRAPHGFTPYIILANIAGVLPLLSFLTLITLTARIRYFFFTPKLTFCGALELYIGASSILFAILAAVVQALREKSRGSEPEPFPIEPIAEPVRPAQPAVRPSAQTAAAAAPSGTRLHSAVLAEADGTQRCSRCGRLLRRGAVYCNICGRRVQENTSSKIT